MGYLDRLFGFSAGPVFPHDANDERAWRRSGERGIWGGHSGQSQSGLYITDDESIGVSCIFLSILIYSGLLGTNPIKFYRDRKEKGEELIYGHPLQKIIGTDGRANPWQTGASWFTTTIAQGVLWGLSISRIKWTEYGMELWPIDSNHITTVDQIEDGRRRFHISTPGRNPEVLLQDECFVLDGFGVHHLIPESLLRRSREAVGLWLSQQDYRSTYFERGAQGSLYAEAEDVLEDKDITRLKSRLRGTIGGRKNAHTIPIFDGKIKLKEFGDSARNAQLTEAWDASAIEISRFTGVPPYLLGASKMPPYASREAAMREFGDLQLKPRRRLIEASIKRDLIYEPDVVCEIDLSEVFLGDALSVAQTNAIYIMNGVLARDEVRQSIGKNPIGGDDMSVPRASVNQGPDRGGDPRQPREDNPGDRETEHTADPMVDALAQILPYVPPRPDTEFIYSKFLSVLEHSARMLFKREIDAVRKKAIQYASNPAEWESRISDFYRIHADKISTALAIPLAVARTYTEAHLSALLQHGAIVCETWEQNDQSVRQLVRLHTEGSTK